jgi:hypothetical protein
MVMNRVACKLYVMKWLHKHWEQQLRYIIVLVSESIYMTGAMAIYTPTSGTSVNAIPP